MSDLPNSSQIVIGIASLVLLCSLAYLFVRWLRNTWRPWQVILGSYRKALLVMQVYGLCLMLSGTWFFLIVFLAGWFFSNQLKSADRNYLLSAARMHFVGGAVGVAMAVVVRWGTSRVRDDESASRTLP